MTTSPIKGNPNNIHYQELNVFETTEARAVESLWMDIYKDRLKEYNKLKDRKKDKARNIMAGLRRKYGNHFTIGDLNEFDKYQFIKARKTLMMF